MTSREQVGYTVSNNYDNLKVRFESKRRLSVPDLSENIITRSTKRKVSESSFILEDRSSKMSKPNELSTLLSVHTAELKNPRWIRSSH